MTGCDDDVVMRRLAAQDPAGPLLSEGSNPAHSARARSSLAEIMSSPRRTASHRRRLVATIGVAALLLAGTGATFAFPRAVTQPSEVYCYAGATTAAPEYGVALDGTPVATCRALWAAGSMGTTLHASLIVCARASGALVVFATDDRAICGREGLATPASTLSPNTTQRLVALMTRLGDLVDANGCMDIRQARSGADRLLASSGLNGWTIERVGLLTSSSPCAGYAADPVDHRIEIVAELGNPPVPSAGSSG